jgi:D-glycero-beta-D-manno-heptose-7-phosphate kinase
MTGNQNPKPDDAEARPKPQETNPQAGQEQESRLSYNDVFAGEAKNSKNPTAHGDEQAKPDPFRLPDDSQLSSHLLTKELSKELTPKNLASMNLSEMQTPVETFISAQGLRAVQMGRKSEYKEPETPRFRTTKDLAKQISPPPLTEQETEGKKPEEIEKEEEKEKPQNDLQVDDIYSDLIVKIPVKAQEEERKTEPEAEADEAKSVFDQMEHSRPHDLGGPLGYRISKTRLKQCIENLSNGRLIVVGDLLIDELLEGKPERISREAPVLILEHVDTEMLPGGAANTAHNVTALGAYCHAFGVAGMDEYSHKLEALLDKHKIAHSIIHDPARPTTVKTRILSKAHSLKQQLLRLDRISHDPIDSAIQMLLVQKLEQLAKSGFHGLLLSDYRAGVICPNVILGCRQFARDNNLVIVVDAQDSFERFQDVDLITPNQPDAEKAVGFDFVDQNSLLRGGKELLTLTGAKAVLITRGANGMSLFRKGAQPFHLPVFDRSEVFDVTGAGDTVVATMTLAMVTGSSPEEATALGNLAAGIVVRKSGTAVTSQEEMISTLEQLSLPEPS